MKKTVLKLVAVLLALCMLSGCSFLGRLMQPADSALTFARMEYERPDLDAIERQRVLVVDMANDKQNINNIAAQINYFYAYYDAFYTNYNLATIYHDSDLTDAYWIGETEFCSQAAPRVEQMLEQLYRDLANSPMREALEDEQYFGEGFFQQYTGEPFYDEGYMSLAAEEARLENLYYELYTKSAELMENDLDAFYQEYGQQFADLLVQMIRIRQEMADYFGYEDYAQLAYDMYYYREYTPQQTARYMEQLGQAVRDIYVRGMEDGRWEWGLILTNENRILDYVRQAAKAMGGKIQEAYSFMEKGGYYNISNDGNMYDGGYEVYLTSYNVPYLFHKTHNLNLDKLSVAHEFGHYAHDYVCQGTYASIDVCEVLSQAMEYLSVLYVDGSGREEAYKMIETSVVMAENACFTLFELRAYELEGDQLTAENLTDLYEDTCSIFGMDWDDPYGFTAIQHFYLYPMYTSSYVYSADVALQIYQQEKTESGKGLETYLQCLNTNEIYLMDFVQQNGLESPFKEERATVIRNTLETLLGY